MNRMNWLWRVVVVALAIAVGCTSDDDDGPDVTPLTAQDLQDSMTIPNSTAHDGQLPAGTSDASAPQVTNIEMPASITLGQSFQVTVSYHTGTQTLAKLLVQIEGADGYLELAMSAVPNTDGQATFPCVINTPSGGLTSTFALTVQLGDSVGTYGAQASEPLNVAQQTPPAFDGGGGGGDSAHGGDAFLPGGDSSAMGCSSAGAPCTEPMSGLEGHCWDAETDGLHCAADCSSETVGTDCPDARTGTCHIYYGADAGPTYYLCHFPGSVAIDQPCYQWYECQAGHACIKSSAADPSGVCKAVCPSGYECSEIPGTTCQMSDGVAVCLPGA